MAYITFIARDKYVASYQLDTDSVTIGRSFDADIFIPDVFVSRNHCRFEKSDKGWMILDTDSRNGIYFKGVRVKRRVLHHEDIVELGSIAFVFDEGDMATPDASNRTPFGMGSRVAELIDTLYAGEARPAEYIRAKGRKPKWAKPDEPEVTEATEAEAEVAVIQEDEAGEWTELDMEWQIASAEVELPPAAKFLLYGPAAFGNVGGLSQLLPNNVDMPIQQGNGSAMVPAAGSPGSFRAAAALNPGVPVLAGAGAGAVPAAAGNGAAAKASFGSASPWANVIPSAGAAATPAKARQVRKPKVKKEELDLSSLREKLDALLENIIFRLRANPMFGAGIGAAAILVVLGALVYYIYNANRVPNPLGVNWNSLTEQQKKDANAANTN